MKTAVKVGEEIVCEVAETGHDPRDFSDIPLPPELLSANAGEAAGQAAATLEELLGGYARCPGKPGWYTRSPKIRQQLAILDIAEGFEGNMKPREIAAKCLLIAEQLLHVQSDGKIRPGTSEEIMDVFDLDEVQKLISPQTGLTFGDTSNPQS